MVGRSRTPRDSCATAGAGRARDRCDGSSSYQVLRHWAYPATVITAVHTIVYADDADAARAFFRDVLGWAHVDAHGGWLIFKTGPSELGVHPTSGGPAGDPWRTVQHHEISLMCDNLTQTVVELEARGADFTRGIRDDGYALTTALKVPGAGEMMLYEPKHPTAFDL
jgi:catechol 2,3-dioxygenase-like lactoylglutathione lyase family enzyme